MTKPSPSYCWQVLAAYVLSKGLLAEMLYLAYMISGSLCLFSLYFIKCANCIHYDVYCDRNFSADDFDRLTME
jgi:hypothetical protein